jgi:hypothetical protein
MTTSLNQFYLEMEVKKRKLFYQPDLNIFLKQNYY